MIAYVAGGPPGTGVGDNAVFVTESTDDGSTWSSPRLISGPEDGPAFELQLVETPNTDLHLVWISEAPQGRLLRHIRSSDGGRTWSKPDDTAPPQGFRALRVAADACGAIHVIYDHWLANGEGGHLDHVVWNGAWESPKHLFPELRSNSADIVPRADGSMVLAFLAQRSDSPLNSPLQSMYSLLGARKE
jgi:hypothetical protein